MPTRSRQHTAVKSGHVECWPRASPQAATWSIRAAYRAQVGELSLANWDGANQKDNLFPFFYLTQRICFTAVEATASGGQDAPEGQKEGLEAGKGCEL